MILSRRKLFTLAAPAIILPTSLMRISTKETDYILCKYKGKIKYDEAFYYAPYIPLEFKYFPIISNMKGRGNLINNSI